MSDIYGAGLLKTLPSTAVDSEEKQIAVLSEFVETGVVLQMYDMLADKVFRVRATAQQPLCEVVTDEAKIAEVRNVMALGGSRPSSHFSFLHDFHVFIPDEDVHGDPITISLPDGNKYTFSYHNMVSGLQALQKVQATVSSLPPEYFEDEPLTQSEYIDFHQEIIDEIIACQKVGVVYSL